MKTPSLKTRAHQQCPPNFRRKRRKLRILFWNEKNHFFSKIIGWKGLVAIWIGSDLRSSKSDSDRYWNGDMEFRYSRRLLAPFGKTS